MSASIKGKVLDKNGIGIPGAIVIAPIQILITDFDGNFSVNAVGEILKISMLGFERFQ
jgi:hypothetical protein